MCPIELHPSSVEYDSVQESSPGKGRTSEAHRKDWICQAAYDGSNIRAGILRSGQITTAISLVLCL